jgi:hypothetical protein
MIYNKAAVNFIFKSKYSSAEAGIIFFKCNFGRQNLKIFYIPLKVCINKIFLVNNKFYACLIGVFCK